MDFDFDKITCYEKQHTLESTIKDITDKCILIFNSIIYQDHSLKYFKPWSRLPASFVRYSLHVSSIHHDNMLHCSYNHDY